MKHNIIPMPNKPIVKGDGVHSISKNTNVDFGTFNSDCVIVFGERTGIILQGGSKDNSTIQLVRNESLKEEEYSLNITAEKITIEASTENGIIWALTSLYHLIEKDTVPCLQLSDFPKLRHRGLMLDCARTFFSVSEVKKMIEEISLVKTNIFHWHLSDDQGFRIESDVFPELHQINNQDYYTKNQIREVVSFAKLRGVEIIPEIDLPGHTTAIISAMPHLTCHNKQVAIKKQGGIFKVTICPGKEETYDFVIKLIDEVSELFESKYFHIGGDEAPTLEWETCDDCKKIMKENGQTEIKWLQSYFTKRLAEHLRKIGKKPVVWNDFLASPDAIQDIDVQYWIEVSAENKIDAFFEKGGATVFSSMPYSYFDYPHAIIPLKKVYEFTPTINGKPCDNAPNIKGMECCIWTERIPTLERLGELAFPRAYAFAEAGWSNTRDYDSFVERVMPLLSKLTEKGINFTPPEEWNPIDAERRKLIVEFFKMFSASMPEKSDVQVVEASDGKADGSELLFLLLQLFEISDPLLIQDLTATFMTN